MDERDPVAFEQVPHEFLPLWSGSVDDRHWDDSLVLVATPIDRDWNESLLVEGGRESSVTAAQFYGILSVASRDTG